MQQVDNSAIMDKSLTPENARTRGYKYIADITFNNTYLSAEIFDLVVEYAHKLGQPQYRTVEEGNAGIYASIKNNGS